MFFKSIPGKEEEKLRLIHQVKEDRIPHAQLFIGRRVLPTWPLPFPLFLICIASKKQKMIVAENAPLVNLPTNSSTPTFILVFPL